MTPTGNPPSLPTDFAPAERASDQGLAQTIKRVGSQEITSELLNAVPDIFLILNATRQVVYANDALAQLLGKSAAEVEVDTYGLRPGEILGCIHAFENEGGCGTTKFCATCGAVKAILSSLQGQADVQECRIALQSGDALDLRVWAKPLELDGEQYTTFAVQDISHEKRRIILERIFFHDVLNTASYIRSVLNLLQTEHMPFAEVEEYLDHVSRRLLDEIKNQQILMAAERGELKISFEAVNARELVTDIGSLQARHYGTNKHIEIIVEAPEDNVMFTSDRVLVTRVLVNIVKNAVEASEAGDTVTLSYSTASDAIVFEVHNPAYMPHDVQLQVFKRSFSTKGEGRGLGTYSIKLLTEKYLGGRVWFETHEEAGTRFMVSYPL